VLFSAPSRKTRAQATLSSFPTASLVISACLSVAPLKLETLYVRLYVAAHLLQMPGNSPANNVKFFATVELLELVKNRAWLAKVTNALNQHWQRKNAATKTKRHLAGRLANQTAFEHSEATVHLT
jgi:hypothetical protein